MLFLLIPERSETRYEREYKNIRPRHPVKTTEFKPQWEITSVQGDNI
jgi:hypothetical protein